MIILITILIILAAIVSWVAWNNCSETLSYISGSGAVFLGIADIIIIVWCCTIGFDTYTINDTIKMYAEENQKIEQQMTTIVQSYKGYEENIVSNIADMEVMLIKFPELKASELVKTQMKVYIKNNDKMKQLKERKINTKVAKWLLYFGK